MRIALDTNLLAYAEGVNGAQRKQVSLGVVQKLSTEDIVVPVQALGELFHVLVRKAGRTPVRARTAVLSCCSTLLASTVRRPTSVNSASPSFRRC